MNDFGLRSHRLWRWPMTYRMAARARMAGAAILLIGFVLVSTPKSVEAQPSQVLRGEYLARAGDCVSCHTASGGQALAGGGRLNTPFGYMLTPNIPPDGGTGIGLRPWNLFIGA